MSHVNHIRCDRCGKRMDVPGGSLLGAPHPQDYYVRVIRICSPCFDIVAKEVDDHEKLNVGQKPFVPELVD